MVNDHQMDLSLNLSLPFSRYLFLKVPLSLAVRPWANYGTSLSLSLLICNMADSHGIYFIGLLKCAQDFRERELLAKCLIYKCL